MQDFRSHFAIISNSLQRKGVDSAKALRLEPRGATPFLISPMDGLDRILVLIHSRERAQTTGRVTSSAELSTESPGDGAIHLCGSQHILDTHIFVWRVGDAYITGPEDACWD